MQQNYIAAILSFALLSHTGYSLTLGTGTCDDGSELLCDLYSEQNMNTSASNHYKICADMLSDDLTITMSDNGINEPIKSYSCHNDDYQYHFCQLDPIKYPNYCMSSGGETENVYTNPFGNTQYMWIKPHDEVKVGKTDENMSPVTSYSKLGCEGVSTVSYQSVPDTKANDLYYMRKEGIASFYIPSGYHVVTYNLDDYNRNVPDNAEPEQYRYPRPDDGATLMTSMGSTCHNLEESSWMSQPLSFCYCKDCENSLGEPAFGPQHCQCAGECVDCSLYPTAPECQPPEPPQCDHTNLEEWFACKCEEFKDVANFQDKCCEASLTIPERIFYNWNTCGAPGCNAYAEDENCPDDCKDQPISTN